jgi:hypothetical protein
MAGGFKKVVPHGRRGWLLVTSIAAGVGGLFGFLRRRRRSQQQ